MAASTGAHGKDHTRAIRLSQALMLLHEGQTAEAYNELLDLVDGLMSPTRCRASGRRSCLLQPLRGEEHFQWFTPPKLQSSLGFDAQSTCAICLEPLAPQPVPQASPRILISTCFHAVHQSCWDGHKAASAGESVRCPVCRHEIVVATAPAVYNPETQETTPLRQGREEEDLRRS